MDLENCQYSFHLGNFVVVIWIWIRHKRRDFPRGDSALTTGQEATAPSKDIEGEPAVVEDGKIRMAVIGDSLARGTGMMKDSVL